MLAPVVHEWDHASRSSCGIDAGTTDLGAIQCHANRTRRRFIDALDADVIHCLAEAVVDFVARPLGRDAGRHRRAICSAEIRKPVIQNQYSCDPDKRGRVLPKQPAGNCLPDVGSEIDAFGFY